MDPHPRTNPRITPQPLAGTGLAVTPVGLGAFKLGRDLGTKYPGSYRIPSEDQATRIIHQMLDLGINYIDTAPAYGLSEERVGRAIRDRPDVVVSTKVGESFQVIDQQPVSDYRYDAATTRASIERSLRRLGRDALDLVFIHSNGDDLNILNQTDVVDTLTALRDRGDIRAVGLSGKTAEGFAQSLEWADAVMVEYSAAEPGLSQTIAQAAERGVGVVVKKALNSGHLTADAALRFVFEQPGVGSVVIGTLNPDHMRTNLAVAAHG